MATADPTPGRWPPNLDDRAAALADTLAAERDEARALTDRLQAERDRARRVAVALEQELAALEDVARYAREVRRYCPSKATAVPIAIPADTLAMLTAALDRHERIAHA